MRKAEELTIKEIQRPAEPVEPVESAEPTEPSELAELEKKENFEKSEIPRETKVLEKIGKATIYLLIFLLPLFFLPWTINVLDFNKQILLLFLVFLGFVCWISNALISGKLKINTSFINLPVIIFVLFSGISVIFSFWRYGSFWGWPLSVSASFISLLGFTIFYFLIVNLFKKNDISLFLFTLFLSGFFVSLFLILQTFRVYILPFGFARTSFFNTVGTINSAAMFLVVLLTLVLPVFFFVKGRLKVILGIFGLTFLLALFLVNSKAVWLALAIGTGILFVFGKIDLKRVNNFQIFVLILLIISLFFISFRFSLFGHLSSPILSFPSQKAEIGILKHLPYKSFLFGTGPSTFGYVWSKYKPVETNQTIFWNTRLNSGASEILDTLITKGILGLLTLFLIFGVFLKLIFNLFFTRGDNLQIKEKFLTLGILSGFCALIAVLFLSPANVSIFLIFWLLLGCLPLLEEKERKIWSLTTLSAKTSILSFFFVLILILTISFFSLLTQRYLAEVKYAQGVEAWQRGDNDASINYLLKATESNPKVDIYWRDLSQIYLTRTNEILQDPTKKQEEKNTLIQSLLIGAVNSANQSTVLNRNDVASWNIRGFVFRNTIGVFAGAGDWAIKSYQEAAKLEPTDPYIFTEIGLVYLAQADMAGQQKKEDEKQENLKSAQDYFEKAISLKADYAPAHFQIAMVRVREGKIREAIEKLELTKQVAPFDTGLAFQLGTIYYNDNQFDKAKAEFERTISLDETYSNARYLLGLIYDREGDKNSAIVQFENIERLNPENEEVKKILSNLRAGKPALEGIVPAQPPIEEKPPERLEK